MKAVNAFCFCRADGNYHDLAQAFEEMRKAVVAECALLRKRDGFTRDLIARCPTLRGMEVLRSRRLWPLGNTTTANGCSASDDLTPGQSAGGRRCGEVLMFEVCALDGSFRWHFDASRLAQSSDHLTILSVPKNRRIPAGAMSTALKRVRW
ncbi:hypothetical protein OKW30_008308 [Paraburkholderia sp. Clong3]|uniref:hypothetical protein n=1 Tax=Paraburkholderia sp. Clong3 TaxID=2991061 RepID=UPI003D1B425F